MVAYIFVCSTAPSHVHCTVRRIWTLLNFWIYIFFYIIFYCSNDILFGDGSWWWRWCGDDNDWRWEEAYLWWRQIFTQAQIILYPKKHHQKKNMTIHRVARLLFICGSVDGYIFNIFTKINVIFYHFLETV